MTQPALTLINPTPDEPAQVVAEESTLTALEERQNLLAHHVRLVARGLSVGLFVYGSQGGLGKSRTVLRTLADEGVSPVLVNSHITPLASTRTLYHNRSGQGHLLRRRGLHLRLDVASRAAAELLSGAIPASSPTGPRQLDDLPGSFIFESRLVFCANVIPKRNDAFKAVLTRCDIFQLDATQEEVIDLMRSDRIGWL